MGYLSILHAFWCSVTDSLTNRLFMGGKIHCKPALTPVAPEDLFYSSNFHHLP